MNGKGDKRRPGTGYDQGYDRIFGNKGNEMAETDRELLELAAKAAGRDVIWKRGMHRGEAYEGLFDRVTGIVTTWNPLTTDGDAMWLAAARNMNLEFNSKYALAVGEYATCSEFYKNDDRMGAMRRAIVRAAAEDAKHMP